MKAQAVVALCPIILSIISAGCATRTVDHSQARPYSIIKERNMSFPGRDRLSVRIVSQTATTLDQRAHTAIKAAADLLDQRRVDMVEVFLDMSAASSGGMLSIGIARYSPDGKGMTGNQTWIWEVEASDTELSNEQIKIVDMWFTHSGSFEDRRGFTDEPKLKKFIAKQLNLPVERITLPWITQKKYLVEEMK